MDAGGSVSKWGVNWILFLAVGALWVFFLEPDIYNSHVFRQAQTAGTIQIFQDEGWDPFHTKVRSLPKPGIAILEFPLYQSLVYLLAELTPVQILGASRMVNFLCWIGLFFVFRGIGEILLKQNKYPKKNNDIIVLFCLSCPLLFSVSQWISIETLNLLLASASFLFFLKYLETHAGIFILFSFLVFTSLSLLLKPNVLFALSPLFIFSIIRNRNQKSRIRAAVFFGLVAILISALWFYYAEKTNSESQSAYTTSRILRQYFWSSESLDPENWVKLFGRLLVYVMGPGLFLFLLFARICGSPRFEWNFFWIKSCILCLVLYALVFAQGNINHNYYQIPLILPLYIFSVLTASNFQQERWSFVPLIIFLISNFLVSQKFLNRSDPDWKLFLANLDPSIERGSGAPNLIVVSPFGGAAPVLGNMFHRQVDRRAINHIPEDPDQYDVIAFCDLTATKGCKESMIDHLPRCKTRFKILGRFWTCQLPKLSKFRL